MASMHLEINIAQLVTILENELPEIYRNLSQAHKPLYNSIVCHPASCSVSNRDSRSHGIVRLSAIYQVQPHGRNTDIGSGLARCGDVMSRASSIILCRRARQYLPNPLRRNLCSNYSINLCSTSSQSIVRFATTVMSQKTPTIRLATREGTFINPHNTYESNTPPRCPGNSGHDPRAGRFRKGL